MIGPPSQGTAPEVPLARRWRNSAIKPGSKISLEGTQQRSSGP